jgi:hypothetical protein
MRSSALTLGIGLALSVSAVAQQPALDTGASSRSDQSVSATRKTGGANASAASIASATAASSSAETNAVEAQEMRAVLSKPVDARQARPGDEVTAKLAQGFKGEAGTPLPRGSKLVGHVTEAQAQAKRSGAGSADNDSRLGIVFDKAVLPNGREVPLTATIQAIAQRETATESGAPGVDAWHDSGTFASSSAARGGGALGGVAGVAGTTLEGAAGAGGGLGRTASSAGGSVTRASPGSVGGVGTSGELLAGSRGVFGMRGVDLVGAPGSAEGRVLTSHLYDVRLAGGTQMLLATQSAVSASGRAGTVVDGAGGSATASSADARR